MKVFLQTTRRNGQKFTLFFMFYTAVAIIVAVSDILMTRITGDMSQAAVGLDTTGLLRFLLFMTAIMGVKAITSALSALLTERYSGSVGYRFRDNFARYFLGLQFGEFEKRNSGGMLSIYSNDIPDAARFTTVHTLSMIGDFITVAASIIFMLTINLWYTLLFIAMFPLFVLMQAKISAPIQKLAIERSQERANYNAIVNDSLQNTSTIIAYSLEEYMENRYLTAYDKYFAATKRYIKTMTKLVLAGISASMTPILVIMVLSGLSVINEHMTLAEFIAFTSIASTASNWLMMLSQRLRDFQLSAAGAKRVIETMAENADGEDSTCDAAHIDTAAGDATTAHIVNDNDTAACIGAATAASDATVAGAATATVAAAAIAATAAFTGGTINGSATCAIRFKNASFSYNADSPPALDNVSFEIAKNESIAIAGGSGSGKSTILKLLLGLYDLKPQSGEIEVFGSNITGIPKAALRACFAYVPQDSFMLPESIGVNITGADLRDADMNALQKACSDAGILEFIDSLPEGFNSVLAESAENVSGGQRQRLAIARALYRDAPVILFDEATSSLDPVTENGILETMKTLALSRTVIMVAHREKVITSCERVLLMDSGKVAGVGSHEDLLRSNASYRALYETMRSENSRDTESTGE